MPPTNCPWCGAGPMTVGRGLVTPLPRGRRRWLCGSMKHGRKPWQDVHCQLNVAEAEVERLQKLEGTDDHPEHRCDRCGGRNIESWYADSDVWNRVAGDFSILCPICFSALAADTGIAPTAWRLSIEGDDPEVSKLRVQLHKRLEEAAGLHNEVERLRQVLRELQWQTMLGSSGSSAYPTCIGCGIVSHGALSTPPHRDECVIENALATKPKE